MKTAFLQLTTKSFKKGKIDELEMRFHSYIEGMGAPQISFLITKYKALLEEMEISFKEVKNENVLILEGYGLQDLLQGEKGIHLFYQTYQNPIPIGLTLNEIGKVKKKQEILTTVRLYNQQNTLTDLRTGFTNDFNLTATEFLPLIYAGISLKVRKNLL